VSHYTAIEEIGCEHNNISYPALLNYQIGRFREGNVLPQDTP
jgi:hypothetical protein